MKEREAGGGGGEGLFAQEDPLLLSPPKTSVKPNQFLYLFWCVARQAENRRPSTIEPRNDVWAEHMRRAVPCGGGGDDDTDVVMVALIILFVEDSFFC